MLRKHCSVNNHEMFLMSVITLQRLKFLHQAILCQLAKLLLFLEHSSYRKSNYFTKNNIFRSKYINNIL